MADCGKETQSNCLISQTRYLSEVLTSTAQKFTVALLQEVVVVMDDLGPGPAGAAHPGGRGPLASCFVMHKLIVGLRVHRSTALRDTCYL